MSHPSWVRGLKLAVGNVWHPQIMSHPSWVRGLKRLSLARCRVGRLVAPLVGAWIETCFPALHMMLQAVAPLVGAWIETKND